MPVHAVDLDHRLNLMRIIAHAHPVVQVLLLIILLLVAASTAAWALRLSRGHATLRADELLSGVLLAAPLLGLTAAAYGVMDMFIGVANVVPTPGLGVLSPGVAEAGFCVLAGLFAASLAALFRAHLRVAAPGAAAA